MLLKHIFKISGIVKIHLALILFLSFIQTNVSAGEIYLKNGDRITGEIVEETEESVTINTEAIGEVSVKKDFVERIVRAEAEESVEKIVEAEVIEEAKEDVEVIWQRQITAGYNLTRGNTENQQLSASVFINRNRVHVDEITLKGSLYYAATEKKSEAEKWNGMARYAFSFGQKKSFYNFYKIEAERDRFAEVNYRLIPAAGVGCWFFDKPETKLLAEVALGLEHTDYRDETEESNELVLIPRAYFEQSVFVNSKLSQDITLYPLLKDTGEYRLHSETKLTNPLSDNLSVNFSLIDDYNSDPARDAESNDIRFISSFTYSW